MEFSTNVVNIDKEWKFKRADLIKLKDSEDDGYLKGEWCEDFIIPGFQYTANIYPNGFYEIYRGQTIICLYMDSVHDGKIHANFVISVESAQFSKDSKCIIETRGGEGEICCKTDEFFDSERKFFVDGEITVRIKGTVKAEYCSSFSHIICPFDIECNFKKSDLLAINDLKNAYLNGKCFYAFNMPGVLYHISIYPNGDNDERRGDTVIFLRVNGTVERKIAAIFTIIIESAKFSKSLKRVFETYTGGGNACCKTSELFDFNNKYFTDENVTVRIKGTLKTEQFFITEIVCPFEREWKFKKSDLMALKDSENGRLKGISYHENEIPGLEYFLCIYPNGNNETYRGETWITLHVNGTSERKITTIFTIFIESVNFSKSCIYVSEIYGGMGSACCKTDKFFNPKNHYFVDDEIIVKVEGIFKTDGPSISDIICPLDIEWKLTKADLIKLKNSENGTLSGKNFYAFNIPGLQYYAAIFPNGNNEERRGQSWIFLYVNGLRERKMIAYFTIFIESANYSQSLIHIYQTSTGWGCPCCKTDEFFDLQNKFFVNGEITIQIKGILKTQRSSISKIASPISLKWKIKEADLKTQKEANGFLRSKRKKIALISGVKWFLKLSLNEVRNDNPPKTGLFIYAEMERQKKIEAVFDFSIESANFNNGVECIFEKTEGYGFLFCLTEDFFDPLKGYIVDGFLTINFNGVFLMEATQNTVLKFKKGVSSKSVQMTDKDFTIFVGDKEIKVHKQILMDASEYFIGMFESGMMESIQNKMIIKEFPFETIEAGINLLYGNSVPKSFELEDMLSLYQFADKYHIQRIMDLVENYLIKYLLPSNVCRLLKFSEPASFNVKNLYQSCIDFLMKCSKRSLSVPGIEILDKDLLASMFLKTHPSAVVTDTEV